MEAETEDEVIMREKDEGIEIVRDEAKPKARPEDDMRRHVWIAKSLGLRNSKNS